MKAIGPSSLLLAVLAVLVLQADRLPEAAAQSKRAPSIKAIDVQAEKTREEFVVNATKLARDYHEAGELEKAKQMLQAILALEPENKPVRDKIKEIEESQLSDNEIEVTIEPGGSWVPVAQVTKDKGFRIQASGSYRLVTQAMLGPDGFPTSDAEKMDLAAGVPCGALMGVYYVDKKAGRPFRIGSGAEFNAPDDGVLLLRVNVPPDSKCTGRLTVTLSGHIKTQAS